MFTFRNELAFGLFLFGTTYLWLTPAFASDSARSTTWGVVQALAFAAIIGFAVAAWGIFQGTAWWEPVAIGSAAIGMSSVIPYWIAAQPLTGDNNIAMVENVAIHFLGAALVAAALLTPAAERWIAGRL